MATQLDRVAIRWYNPEYFPTVDLLTVSEAGAALNPPIQDFTGNNTTQTLDACDVVGSWSENYFAEGGGTLNINDNPVFPDVIRLTACVQNPDYNEFPDSESPTVNGNLPYAVSLNSLGSQNLQLPYPSGGYGGTAWSQYTNCIDNNEDDCGQYLYFQQGNTGTMINMVSPVYLSLSHKDLTISGWTGCTTNITISGSENMSYIGDNPDLEADYTLTSDDITTADDGMSCLSILDGTTFGANGVYQAEFNVGDRVRIYGSRPEFNTDNLVGQGVHLSQIFPDFSYTANSIFFGSTTWGEGVDINQFFNGDQNYTDFMNVGGNNTFMLSMNNYGMPEDIDGQGFLSPFFINLWRASVSVDVSYAGDTSVTDNIMVNGDQFGTNSDPLNPDLLSIRWSNIYSRIDSRIKYVIFQNTLGMMYDNPSWNNDMTSQQEYYDYGQVPLATQNNQTIEARRHNKVHVYIVFRDEWVGTPIEYGADDSRNTVNLDIDGRARLVAGPDEGMGGVSANDLLENL